MTSAPFLPVRHRPVEIAPETFVIQATVGEGVAAMATYQHLLPGMGAAATTGFQDLLATERDRCDNVPVRRRVTVIGRRSTDQSTRHPRSQRRGDSGR